MNEDPLEFARVDTTELEWARSPSPGVWRKRCYLDGSKEKGAVTSVVRYDEGSEFPTHEHPEGEELFVLDGVFTDAHGDHPKGTFVLNPPGSSHAPASKDGCKLFVRLRQYDGDERVRVDTNDAAWEPHAIYEGVQVLELYRDASAIYTLMRLDEGTSIEGIDIPHGEEVFVVEGAFTDVFGQHEAGTWVRYPPATTNGLSSEEGCTLLVKKRLETLVQLDEISGTSPI